MGEQRSPKPPVGGSSPPTPAIFLFPNWPQRDSVFACRFPLGYNHSADNSYLGRLTGTMDLELILAIVSAAAITTLASVSFSQLR